MLPALTETSKCSRICLLGDDDYEHKTFGVHETVLWIFLPARRQTPDCQAEIAILESRFGGSTTSHRLDALFFRRNCADDSFCAREDFSAEPV